MENSKRMLKRAYKIAEKYSDKVVKLAYNQAFEPVFYCEEQFDEEIHYFFLRVDFNTQEVWFKIEKEGSGWTMWFQF